MNMNMNRDTSQNPMINHEMQDALSSLNETNYFMFFYQTPELVEDEDISKLKKNVTIIGRNLIFSLILGVTINVQIKRLPKIDFLHWNKYLRWVVRLPLFIGPYFLIFHYNMRKNYSDIFGLHLKYFKRLRGFQKTGDLRYLDPKGKLMQKFQ